jgi:hypothetical protein
MVTPATHTIPRKPRGTDQAESRGTAGRDPANPLSAQRDADVAEVIG